MKNYVKARSYYNRASALHLELENYRGYSNVLNNLGLLSTDEGDDVTALGWYEKAMEYFLMVQNMEGVADTWRNKGAAYFNLGNFQKAQEACEKALAISEELEISESTLQACDCLREVFQTTGDFRKAFEFQKRYYDLRDQLKGDENVMELTTMQLEHQFGQQMLADSLLAAQRESQLRLDQEILEKEKQQKQRETVLISIGGGIIIFSMALLLVNIQRSNQRKKKDNLLIKKQKEEVERQKEVAEHQRELVEEKNKEILDSINYARRLQDAILPPQKLVKEYLPNSFILYKPKDIVAGDFYWMETVDDTIYFAAADCTGHGVPGAMVSVVCSNALTKAVMEDGLREPGEILDRTRDLVIKRFSKSEEGVRDGMDISWVALPSRPPTVGSCHGMTLRWAGANNPLWIIRKNVDDMAQVDGVTELVEVKADKQPIGNYEDAKPFTTHQIALYPGDSLYIFSDGFHDQFGGEKGKKYKSANLKQFLLQICAKPHSEQRQLLIEEFDRWKGEIEQIDDVCIIGLAV
jgi:serine phosphatase RsbU (regulator of sigma subunit)